MVCPILELLIPQEGKWAGYIPTLFVFLGIGAISMNWLRDYLDSHATTSTKKLRLPPTGGNIRFHFPPMTIPPPPRIFFPPHASQRFVLSTEVLDIQLEPVLGHTAWHNNPNFAEVRVPLEAERVGVRGRAGTCYDGRVEMWWDGRKGVGLVRL